MAKKLSNSQMLAEQMTIRTDAELYSVLRSSPVLSLASEAISIVSDDMIESPVNPVSFTNKWVDMSLILMGLFPLNMVMGMTLPNQVDVQAVTAKVYFEVVEFIKEAASKACLRHPEDAAEALRCFAHACLEDGQEKSQASPEGWQSILNDATIIVTRKVEEHKCFM